MKKGRGAEPPHEDRRGTSWTSHNGIVPSSNKGISSLFVIREWNVRRGMETEWQIGISKQAPAQVQRREKKFGIRILDSESNFNDELTCLAYHLQTIHLSTNHLSGTTHLIVTNSNPIQHLKRKNMQAYKNQHAHILREPRRTKDGGKHITEPFVEHHVQAPSDLAPKQAEDRREQHKR